MPRIKGQTIKPKTDAEKAAAKKKARANFQKYASKRATGVINGLASLSKCSNRRSYEYDAADVAKLKKALSEATDACIAIFEAALKGGSTTTASAISFD